MEKRSIGSLSVSVAGVGCNNFGVRLDEKRTQAVVHAALDLGVNFFDTADVYGATRSEEFLGRALAGRRASVFIASKFGLAHDGGGSGGASPAYIRSAVEASLRRLGTDYIDLFQLHRPDPAVPIAETLGALDDLVRAGKVREIGNSNMSGAQLEEAARATKPGAARFVSAQNEYSLLARNVETEVLPEVVRQGLAFLPYFPLAGGLLSGKYRLGQPLPAGTRLTSPGGRNPGRFLNDANLSKAEALLEFALAQGHSLLELAFAWLLAQRGVTSVIAGASSPEQVQANVAAVSWRLGEAELRQVEARLSTPSPRSETRPSAGQAT